MGKVEENWVMMVMVVMMVMGVAKGGESKSRESVLVGGWSPIEDVKERHVVEIAEFAVAEYNRRSNSHLKLGRVVRGETQVVAGVNYKLVIDAFGSDDTYEAVVWKRSWLKSIILTSFTPLSAPPP